MNDFFEPLIDAGAAGRLLGIHPKTVQRMARAGQLPGIRIGSRWRFRVSLLNQWLEKGLVVPHESAVQWMQPVAPRELEERK